MDDARVKALLEKFGTLRIAVFGDLFLDKYLEIDPALEEISIETGKPAHQIVGKRTQPGAAGTVCNNLAALGVGRVGVISIIGDDGEGYELKKALRARRIEPLLIESAERFTPTYTKPMSRQPGGEVELERQDTKNRRLLLKTLEGEIIAKLKELAPDFDAIIVADQVEERDCGVITSRVREVLAELPERCPNTLFYADSRVRIGEFSNVIVKPNRFECVKAMREDPPAEPPSDLARQCARELMERTGRTVFLTLDKEGICPTTPETQDVLPCPPVDGPIDIVGAGDSVSAGIVSALCAGATPNQAAVIGNLVASVTIRQLGTTGQASPEQVMEAWNKHKALYASA
ncbi:MAG: carbohydrate kinase [bacterium]|nr:carbohydrate kinase [bacterium]